MIPTPYQFISTKKDGHSHKPGEIEFFIKDCLQNTLNPKGVAVVIEAQHLCMQMRGVEKQHSSTTTSAFSGIFLKDEKTRSEFMNLIK